MSAPKTLVELFAEPGRKIAERNTATERERAAVVAWLRAFEPSSGATITDDLARLIERGEHIK